MSTRRHVTRYVGLAATVVMLGCTSADGTGSTGQDSGAISRNDINGVVTDGSHPLAGVSVAAAPGPATATTGVDGTFSLAGLAVGAYEVTFSLAGYAAKTVRAEVSAVAPTTLSVTLDVTSSSPSVVLTDQLAVGYASPVTVVAAATGNGALTYAWKQVGGPPATLTGATTSTLHFTTQDFGAAIGAVAVANARFDTLGINPDQALQYQFELLVTDALGHAATATVTVNATRPTTGLRMVPVGVPVWLQGNGPLFPLPPLAPATTGAAQTTWMWTLDASAAPGSTAILVAPTSQFPHFIPDITGTYSLTETVSKRTLKVYAGTWLGEMTAASQTLCFMCHGGGTNIAPDVFPPWEGTAHYSALQRKLEGVEDAGFTDACLSCHVVGYDKLASAKNNGFDDVAATSNWTFPATLQVGNWKTLEDTPSLGPLAGIQCESCHGPQVGGATGPHANATNLGA